MTTNSAPSGGAVYATYHVPLVQLTGCTLANNTATDADGGGGVHFNSPRGVLRVDGGSALTGNVAAAGSGGGVMVEAAHLLHVQNASLSGNVAAQGGGGAVGFAKRDAVRDLATCVNGVRGGRRKRASTSLGFSSFLNRSLRALAPGIERMIPR